MEIKKGRSPDLSIYIYINPAPGGLLSNLSPAAAWRIAQTSGICNAIVCGEEARGVKRPDLSDAFAHLRASVHL